ncbi:MAG: hypothetical protein AB7D96_07640 [Arcobacteraceae bacterium]
MKLNILIINLKGGAAKSTNSSIVASYLPNAKLLEIDKINQSDDDLKNKNYESQQIDFVNETDENFYEFEQQLLCSGIKVIDVGAVKLEIFHRTMKQADLYNTIDIVIIPAMDGQDDYRVAVNYLNTIKDEIDLSKVLFSFNRYNESEYPKVEKQFSSFFSKKDAIKKAFGIDLDKNYYVIKDAMSIKEARRQGITLRSLIDEDREAITAAQRDPNIDDKQRWQLTEKRSLVINAQNLYRDYISKMLQKINEKIEG